jgi:hypothetical protein
MLKLIRNWLMDHTNRLYDGEPAVQSNRAYESLAFENKLEYRKALSSSTSQLRMSSRMMDRRPQSSKFSTINFDKPVIRCSGKYETIDQRYLREELEKKSLNFGRSRMTFKGKMTELEIPNYVQREPSRPPSSHKFREVQKDRWMVSRDFLNC